VPVLKRPLIYSMADSLGLTLHYDAGKEKITGKGEREVNVSGLKLSVPMEVVSSLLTDNAYMLMVKLIGNLALFMAVKTAAGKDVVDLHLLNLAKMDRLDGWLEKEKPTSVNDVLRKLQKATVASFLKTSKDKWEPAE